MTKTFKELREATGNIIKRIIGPAEIRELKQHARQLSAAFQADIPTVLEKLEAKLNYFGYTLGEIDLGEPFDDVMDDEVYFILVKNDSEIVKNAYLKCSWEKLSSGQQAPLGMGGSALRYSVCVEVNEVSPEELQRMIDDIMLQDEPGEDGYILPEPVGALPKPTTDDLTGTNPEDVINRAIKGDEEGGKPFGQDDDEDEEDDEENNRDINEDWSPEDKKKHKELHSLLTHHEKNMQNHREKITTHSRKLSKGLPTDELVHHAELVSHHANELKHHAKEVHAVHRTLKSHFGEEFDLAE